MDKKTAKFLVIGGGAIGGAVAAALTRAGYDVALACKRRETAELISSSGLRLSGALGNFTAKVRAAATAAELGGPFDYVLVAVKGPDLAEAVRGALSAFKTDSLVVSMQNGICVDTLAEVVGTMRTVGCVVGWGSTMTASDAIDVTSSGEFVIGRPWGKSDDRLTFLAEALGSLFKTDIAEDILDRLWSKLIVNSCITSLGALCGLTLGKMMARLDARRLFFAVIREALAVAAAIGITVPPYAGKLDYYKLLAGKGPLHSARRHVFLMAFGFKYRRLKSSMLQSLERGRRTEIDWFNGYIESKGRAAGVATPVNGAITAMVREMEEGKRAVDPAGLASIKR
jgi:2-dehydropantoate 2-reductase